MTLRIRPLEMGDIVELQRIDLASHGEHWSHRAFVDEIERDDRLHLVALEDSAILGHAAGWFDDPIGRISNVAIDTPARGERLGSRLLLALVNELCRPSIAALQLEVRATNSTAQRLYRTFGFVPIGVERNFYGPETGLTNVDAIVMRAEVTNDAWLNRIEAIGDELKAEAA